MTVLSNVNKNEDGLCQDMLNNLLHELSLASHMVIRTLLLLGTGKLKYSFFFCNKNPTHLSSYWSPYSLWTHPKSRVALLLIVLVLQNPPGCLVMLVHLWWLCFYLYSQTQDHVHRKPEHFRDGGAGNSDLWGIRRSNSHHYLELWWACLHWRRPGKKKKFGLKKLQFGSL